MKKHIVMHYIIISSAFLNIQSMHNPLLMDQENHPEAILHTTSRSTQSLAVHLGDNPDELEPFFTSNQLETSTNTPMNLKKRYQMLRSFCKKNKAQLRSLSVLLLTNLLFTNVGSALEEGYAGCLNNATCDTTWNAFFSTFLYIYDGGCVFPGSEKCWNCNFYNGNSYSLCNNDPTESQQQCYKNPERCTKGTLATNLFSDVLSIGSQVALGDAIHNIIGDSYKTPYFVGAGALFTYADTVLKKKYGFLTGLGNSLFFSVLSHFAELCKRDEEESETLETSLYDQEKEQELQALKAKLNTLIKKSE